MNLETNPQTIDQEIGLINVCAIKIANMRVFAGILINPI